MPDKFKKKIKEFFGKKVYGDITHSELGGDTTFTVGKRKTKAKINTGKRIYKGKEKELVDSVLKSSYEKDVKKKGGMINRFKHGGIIQHD